jgi:hypothetical protein
MHTEPFPKHISRKYPFLIIGNFSIFNPKFAVQGFLPTTFCPTDKKVRHRKERIGSHKNEVFIEMKKTL